MGALQRSLVVAPAALAEAPGRSDDRAYLALSERVAEAKVPCFWPAAPGKRPLTVLERVGLIRLVSGIAGPGGEDEMLALIEAMRHAPRGDVVELGASSGRSAALLAWLARRYEIGALLCVGAWQDETALRTFEIDLVALAQGRLNYLHTEPRDAASRYGSGLRVATEAFGETEYEGRIALLHLAGDGDGVERDLELWRPHVIPTGWIVFDDWAFDTGVRRAADAFVAREEARIAARFRAGPALFVQLKR
jgi:hypothetical protein